MISRKHALLPAELKFCKIYLGFGETNHTEAYRRSFMVKRKDGQWVEPPGEGLSLDEINALEPPSPKEVSRRAKTLLKQDYIQQYITEIARPAGQHARGVLTEQVIFGSEQSARKAAEQVLSQEDKLGILDATFRWAEILRDIGAEIEVPLPTRFEKRLTITCDKCGEQLDVHIDEPLTARAPFAEMFPKKGED